MNELFHLKQTIAIVTGAGQGNGQAISEGLSRAGAKVIDVDIKFENVEINDTQILGDVTSSQTIYKVIKKLESSEFDHIVLVNNAGITFPHDGKYPIEDWRRTLEVNLTAPFLWIEGLSSIFKAKKSGSIINITSLGAERAFPNNPAYVASKGGLKMLTKYYAKMLGIHGIRVNNVGPGYMLTEMTRKSFENEATRLSRERHTFLGRWGESKDLIGVCIFLAAPCSSYVTGQDIYIDGGWTANGLVQ